MAKDLIRTRHQIEKFYKLKSQLQGVSLRIQVNSSIILKQLFIALIPSVCLFYVAEVMILGQYKLYLVIAYLYLNLIRD